MAKYLTNASKSFQIPRSKAVFSRTHVAHEEAVGHCLPRKGHVSRRSKVSAIVTRPAVIPRCRASCWNFGIAAEFVCSLRNLCGCFRFGHYVNAPCRLFVVFNVTGAFYDGIGFAGDAIGEIVILMILFASKTETGKDKTKCEQKSEYRFCLGFYHSEVSSSFVSRGQKERPRLIVPVRSAKTRSVHNKPGRISKYTVRCTLQLFELGGFTGSVVI